MSDKRDITDNEPQLGGQPEDNSPSLSEQAILNAKVRAFGNALAASALTVFDAYEGALSISLAVRDDPFWIAFAQGDMRTMQELLDED
jgi:hypothetical protein